MGIVAGDHFVEGIHGMAGGQSCVELCLGGREGGGLVITALGEQAVEGHDFAVGEIRQGDFAGAAVPAPATSTISPACVCERTSAAIRRNGSAFGPKCGRMLAWALSTVYRTIQPPSSQLAVSRLRPAR